MGRSGYKNANKKMNTNLVVQQIEVIAEENFYERFWIHNKIAIIAKINRTDKLAGCIYNCRSELKGCQPS